MSNLDALALCKKLRVNVPETFDKSFDYSTEGEEAVRDLMEMKN